MDKFFQVETAAWIALRGNRTKDFEVAKNGRIKRRRSYHTRGNGQYSAGINGRDYDRDVREDRYGSRKNKMRRPPVYVEVAD